MATPHIAKKEPLAIEIEAGKDYWWCACGLSKNQPFCDGAHKKEAVFSPVKWTAEKTGTRWFCGCKNTKGQPFCDGTHKSL